MKANFKNIGLMCKQKGTDAADTLNAVITHLANKKVNIILEKDTAKILPYCDLKTLSQDDLAAKSDLIIVVGGDGSLLNSARVAAIKNTPVIGINRGFLGFLADISPNNLAKLDEVLLGNFQEEQRFLLHAACDNKSKETAENLALNDVVLLSSTPGRMLEFAVHIDDKFVCDYRADGLIIATPTGSTAYALSGGGPIIQPNLEAISLVPMFSHNLTSRPIVINSQHAITITFYEKNTAAMHVSCDGQQRFLVPPCGKIYIHQAKQKLRLLHPLDYNYYETLRSKLNWEN